MFQHFVAKTDYWMVKIVISCSLIWIMTSDQWVFAFTSVLMSNFLISILFAMWSDLNTMHIWDIPIRGSRSHMASGNNEMCLTRKTGRFSSKGTDHKNCSLHNHNASTSRGGLDSPIIVWSHCALLVFTPDVNMHCSVAQLRSHLDLSCKWILRSKFGKALKKRI